MSIRKALGAVKDQTTISIMKVSSDVAPELDVAVVKATSHDDEPADEKYIRRITHMSSYSRGHVAACVAAISRRLSRTRDWVVALKALMLIHRLLSDGDPAFRHEILHATRRGARLLNMSDFRDEAHSNSWDHSNFVRTFSMYLDQRLECLLYLQKSGSGISTVRQYQSSPHDDWRSPSPDMYNYGNGGDAGRRSSVSPMEEKKAGTPIRDLPLEKVLGRMQQLQQLLDRFLACRPTGAARHSRMVLVSLYHTVKESFQLYADLCEVLAVLLDRFFDMEYGDCVKTFDAYASTAKQIDELCSFYGWCKEIGVARSSEYPEVQKISDKLLETLEEFLRDRRRMAKSPAVDPVPVRKEEPVEDMNAVKALPAPEDFNEIKQEPEVEAPKPAAAVPTPTPPHVTNLVDLTEPAGTADEQGNKLALALFSGPPASADAANGKGSWEPFGTDKDEVNSAWQNPAAEQGKADWELALVETASHLSKQKATLGGGFDSLLLNGMYDQGAVRQHVSAQASSGSSSSVALPAPGQTTKVLALPAPDGSMQAAVGGDPFAASLCIPPPSYVQMSEMEKKQGFLVQEQQMWNQYQRDGMQGQASLNKLSNGNYHYGPTPGMPPQPPYGMPASYNGGYYY